MTEEETSKLVENNRKRFIRDWSHVVHKIYDIKPDSMTTAYIELTVSQIMDSSIMYANALDIGYDNGYELQDKD